MPLFTALPIMPKEIKTPMQYHQASSASAPYPYPPASTSNSGQRNAAIWTSSDDEILLQARASGLNWQPIANKHFPNKTANACRKRHERLIERRHVEDWDTHKLELLAQEYLVIRKEMWEMLAERVGERWQVVEAKVSTSFQLNTICITTLTLPPVHGERHQDPPSNHPHGCAQSLCNPEPAVHLKQPRYFTA